MITGLTLTIYIGVAVFGLVRSSSEYYTTFVLAIVFMASLLAFRQLIDERINDTETRFWWFRIGAALIGSVLAVGGGLFIRVYANHLEMSQPYFSNFEFWMGFAFMTGVLLINLLHWGWLLTSIVVLAICYFFFGYMIPNPMLQTPFYDPMFVMNYIGLGVTDGFFWLSRIAADSIYFLVIYAAILLGVGMMGMVMEVGKATGNHLKGGAAFPAIVGSGIVASVMGQAVSNVVLTGRLTIPMMKKHGYRSEMAGAIEAMASTAGQIMPPILGLAGFMIAGFLGMAYIDVAMAALIPALLFMSGIIIAVVVSAYREDLPKLNERVDMGAITRLLPTFLISFGAVVILLVGYFSPAIAGMVGIILALTLCPFQGRFRPKMENIVSAFEEGLVIVTILSLLLIAIGPLGQAIMTTNLASRLGILLVQHLPDTLFLLLVAAMIISIILGLGMPTPVAYVMVALTVAPFVYQLGVERLPTHFFVFYFAVFSTLTPPVAVSVLAAAKLADAPFFGTAIDAMKMMMTTFIIPFGFIYHPELLAFPNLTMAVVAPILLLVTLQWTWSVASYGYFMRRLDFLERLAFSIVTLSGFVLLVKTNTMTLTFFVILLFISVAWVLVMREKSPSII